MSWSRTVASLVFMLGWCGCGEQDGDDSSPAVRSSDDIVYETVGFVLEDSSAGSELCYTVLTSFPPQCRGPRIVGWDWDTVAHEAASGTRWGHYNLVGRWDNVEFFVEHAGPADGPIRLPDGLTPLSTPCSPPVGGWPAPDSSRTTADALSAATVAVESRPENGGSWIDLGDRVVENERPDYSRAIFNVLTTGDLEAMEAVVRREWGGNVCVRPAAVSLATLTAWQIEILGRIANDPGYQYSSVDVAGNRLVLGVLRASDALRRTVEAVGDRVFFAELLMPR